MSVIRTEDLGKVYKRGSAALVGLDLEVRPAEVFGFLGPNGAGKSTTIQLLLNMISPTSGAAYLFDEPVTRAETRRRIGYVPESVSFPRYYSGRSLLEFYGGLAGLGTAERTRRATEMLQRVGLGASGEQSIPSYSKGMRQRLALAQALLDEPDLLILDEPTSNLDPVARRELRDMLLDLKSKGTAVFICSHFLSEVESVCDRVAILQNGALKRLGTLNELSSAAGARIVVKGLPPGAIEALSSTGAGVTVRQDETSIACADDGQRQAVERLLEQFDVDVERVETETQSLEEIFFGSIEDGGAE